MTRFVTTNLHQKKGSLLFCLAIGLSGLLVGCGGGGGGSSSSNRTAGNCGSQPPFTTVTVCGKVINTAGNPVSGIQVALTNSSSTTTPTLSATTDSNGNYSFASVPANASGLLLTNLSTSYVSIVTYQNSNYQMTQSSAVPGSPCPIALPSRSSSGDYLLSNITIYLTNGTVPPPAPPTGCP